MTTRSSIAFEDFLGSSIAPQVMPPCQEMKLIHFFVANNVDAKKLAFMSSIYLCATGHSSHRQPSTIPWLLNYQPPPHLCLFARCHLWSPFGSITLILFARLLMMMVILRWMMIMIMFLNIKMITWGGWAHLKADSEQCHCHPPQGRALWAYSPVTTII